jgi:hypothetical protein
MTMREPWRRTRCRPAIGALLVCSASFASTACDEVKELTSPEAAQAQTPEGSTERELLQAVLSKLDSMDVRFESQMNAFEARLDSVVEYQARLAGGGALASGPGRGGPNVIDENLCYTRSVSGVAKAETVAKGEGMGKAVTGAEALGNGATLFARLQAAFGGKFELGGGHQLTHSICFPPPGSAAPGATLASGPPPPPAGGGGDPALDQLRDQVLALAQEFDLSVGGASRSLQTIRAPLDFAHPFAGADQMIGSLPLPGDVRKLFQDPAGVLRAVILGSGIGTDFCHTDGLVQTLFAPEVAEICALAEDIPPPREVIDILIALHGIPPVIDAIQHSVGLLQDGFENVSGAVDGLIEDQDILRGDLTDVCDGVNAMRTRNVTVPRTRNRRVINEVFGNLFADTYFPERVIALFSGIGSVC